jgi:hypothetical protein
MKKALVKTVTPHSVTLGLADNTEHEWKIGATFKGWRLISNPDDRLTMAPVGLPHTVGTAPLCVGNYVFHD